MTEYTVTDDLISSPQAAAYFSTADHRILRGLRNTLEMLGIPVPDYAKRKTPGRPPSRVIAAAYEADHGKALDYNLASRKPNASPEAVAAVRHARAQRFNS